MLLDDLLANGTPRYAGAGQPRPGQSGIVGDLLEQFGSLLASGSTPPYQGNGQPSAGSGSRLFPAAPAYRRVLGP